MKLQDFKIPETLKAAQFFAVLTDRVVCGLYEGNLTFIDHQGPVNDLEDKLLEIRVFNQNEEFRAYRPYKGMEFRVRYINDSEGKACFDEVHFLDQNSRLTESAGNGFTRFTTTGGGAYVLPGGKGLRKVLIRNYLSETAESNGIQFPTDWRIVAFGDETLTAEGENGHG